LSPQTRRAGLQRTSPSCPTCLAPSSGGTAIRWCKLPALANRVQSKNQSAGPLCDASEPLRLISMVILLRAVSSVAVARAAVSITRAPLVARSVLLQADDRWWPNPFVGVAPFSRDSGTMHGRRTVCGGRAPVRTALYDECRIEHRRRMIFSQLRLII